MTDLQDEQAMLQSPAAQTDQGNRPSISMMERLLVRWLRHLEAGELTLVFPSGGRERLQGRHSGPAATVRINRLSAVRRLALGGDLGFAAAYMDGDWDTPDLGALMDLALANSDRWQATLTAHPIAAGIANLRHRLRRNSRAGSRRNIAYHYDLGNAFYEKWLDGTMTYSSAIYQTPDQPLAGAQKAKYRRIIEELDIGPDDHVLEIGCGWGGFAEQVLQETGCRLTGLTLSKEQAAFARQRLHDKGLSDRADIRLEDYRDCKGRYSRIVSIEMFEAVGEENWPVYFDRVRDLLSPSGEAMIQVITIAEDRFEQYRRQADFIQTYIFPGGMLPSVERFSADAQKSSLAIRDVYAFGRDYERTLLEWDRDFRAAWPSIKPLGFDDRFHRMWHYYLQYCAVGFRSGRLDVVQFRLASKG
ncbi:MAG: cyclopropane-fatty-acyl-phospholipid synthase [Neorhizobium sp.]|nr:cyclopropane-fatty-acyl-phospholipid synthase [Neorhizobium sp.]